jgi:hypothetical protein
MNNNDTKRTWRPAPLDLGKRLEVSSDGLIKRLSFTITTERGERHYKEKVLKPSLHKYSGYLRSAGRWIAPLVAQTFKVDGYEKWLKNPEKYSVDHIDRNKTNNHAANLRFATRSEQKHNSGTQRNNQTGYRGVCKDPRKKAYYRYQIQHQKITYTSSDVGAKAYKTAEEAARARDLRVIELEKEGIIPIGSFLNFSELREQLDTFSIDGKQAHNIGKPVGGIKSNLELVRENDKNHARNYYHRRIANGQTHGSTHEN